MSATAQSMGLGASSLDYFDAQIIGLTATPTVQTMAFFGENLVAQYPYEKSVADGVNVPFEISASEPSLASTADAFRPASPFLSATGILVPSATGCSTMIWSIHHRTWIAALSLVTRSGRCWRPTGHPVHRAVPGAERSPKTLIFAKDDNHAEEIVTIAREVFGRGNDFAKKITYRVGAKYAEDLIGQFRNAYYPRIAVTVDMIATGTDVKAIEVLIFLRERALCGLFRTDARQGRPHHRSSSSPPSRPMQRSRIASSLSMPWASPTA